ncbi:pre-rRNA-processing protein TSR2 (macronuclear) [Tetrahymena thermophila SB210]|uniref:Pre-rRNA-processing protein TSR2 n=1 Tax=Tetrahymena thermophila (strain SB210) TaxID=312017 RepID=I7MHN9_TETTS|nr:pre-rRNA-processing protein TSR2 [Tetrahymena thermophila SB210]EAS03150.1 pre-rRNA-processing protein TSR2 [Tetrahymena thermophila SB210]|eukprot:XP_001023395.1 pre-rRNA-processing protein TSR2 [Tetrahymena thermophila SB210]
MDSKNQYEEVDRRFKEGLTIIVLNWPVIKLIVQNGWVGQNEERIRDDPEAKQLNLDSEFKSESQVVQDFIEDLFQYIIKYDCKPEDLEDWLLKEIEYRFYTLIEDNSEKEMTKAILSLFNELEDGKYTLYEEVKKMGALMKNVKVNGQCGNKDDDDSDEEGEDWEDSSVIGPNDKVEEELTEEELQKIAEEKAEEEKKKQIMEEDGFSVVSSKKKK